MSKIVKGVTGVGSAVLGTAAPFLPPGLNVLAAAGKRGDMVQRATSQPLTIHPCCQPNQVDCRLTHGMHLYPWRGNARSVSAFQCKIGLRSNFIPCAGL